MLKMGTGDIRDEFPGSGGESDELQKPGKEGDDWKGRWGRGEPCTRKGGAGLHSPTTKKQAGVPPSGLFVAPEMESCTHFPLEGADDSLSAQPDCLHPDAGHVLLSELAVLLHHPLLPALACE